MHRRTILGAAALAGLGALAPAARAHHGWSRFDLARPLYLEGTAREVAWRNPHAELVLMPRVGLALPADLARRQPPAQQASVDAAGLLKAAVLPKRLDAPWQVELAPLPRMEAWQVPTITAGQSVAVLGFSFAGEPADAPLRVEFLFVGDRIFPLRSAPA